MELEQNTKSKPILAKNMKRYLTKENAACQLITGNGSGFFCKFIINNKPMKALFTNNHVLKEDLIKNNSNILIRHNDEIKEIKLTQIDLNLLMKNMIIHVFKYLIMKVIMIFMKLMIILIVIILIINIEINYVFYFNFLEKKI